MKVLFISPQPFFQERGTPIATLSVLKVLTKRTNPTISIDLACYHEGSSPELPNLKIHRIPNISYLNNVLPGPSLKKLLCDIFLFLIVIKLVWTHGRKHYQLIHAVEEAGFMAYLIKLFTGIPYIYDMDSCMSEQVVEKWVIAKHLKGLFQFFEKRLFRNSQQILAVCPQLVTYAESLGARNVSLLSDYSMLDEAQTPAIKSLREECGISSAEKIILYVGNLEFYQGIDLLLESFHLVASEIPDARLVIVGGAPEHVEAYQRKIQEWDSRPQVFLLGQRPLNYLASYLSEATILVSPRLKGNNTPMKIYSYLQSRRPLLATAIGSHTQVLDQEISELANASPESFSLAIKKLTQDSERRGKIAEAAFQHSKERYTFEAFARNLNFCYDFLQQKNT